MKFPVLFLIASLAGRGNGNFTCVKNSHCKGDVCEEDGCVGGCEDGYYGRYCTNPCSSGCKDKWCSDQGQCTGDCVDGKWGMTCGLECLSKCKSCNKTSGSLCIQCKEFEYGSVCDGSCRETCPRTGCDMNGDCTQTCSERSSEDCVPSCGVGCKSCNEVIGVCDACHGGFRGQDCGIYCINCLGNCTDNGCVNGCKLGYFGTQCQSRCNANCENEICSQVSGKCSDGCKKEYYGLNCGARCNEHCKAGICDRITGECVKGCSRGYYGQHCRIRCTHCRDEMCNSESGECTDGCKKGYFGKKCREECPPNCSFGYCTRFDGVCYTPVQGITTPATGGTTPTYTYYIAGGCVFVVLIVCLLIFRCCRCIYLRKPRKAMNCELGSERRNNMSLPPIPCEPQISSNDYSYIDEEFVIPRCETVSVGRVSDDAEQSLINSSLPSGQHSSLVPRFILLENNKADLNAFELLDVSVSGERSRDITTCQKVNLRTLVQEDPNKKNQLGSCVSGKYLVPVNGDMSSV